MPRIKKIPEPRPCEWCKEEFIPKAWKFRRRRFCSVLCARRHCVLIAARSDKSRELAKIRGIARRGTGNKTKYLKVNYVHEHRVIASFQIGRPLLKEEIVHHIDGNSWNNDPSNLQVMTRAEHSRIHSTKNRKCSLCDKKHHSLGFCLKHYRKNKKEKLVIYEESKNDSMPWATE